MIANCSSPAATVIPVLAYADVAEAAEWLCRAFGFALRLRIGTHRAQLVFGDGAVIVTDMVRDADARHPDYMHSVHVRVRDAEEHHARAIGAGARIIRRPTDYPFGARQYTVDDLGGHRWTFSQSIADVDPASWGGTAP